MSVNVTSGTVHNLFFELLVKCPSDRLQKRAVFHIISVRDVLILSSKARSNYMCRPPKIFGHTVPVFFDHGPQFDSRGNLNLVEDLKLVLQVKLPRGHTLKFTNLFHHLIDVFCGQKNELYNCYSDIYSMLEWWDLLDQSKIFLKKYYSNSNSNSEALKSLPASYSSEIKKVLDVRDCDLKNELTEKTHEISPAYLRSFDWKVMLTLASDKMSQMNEPRLLLDLDISGNNDKLLQLDLGKDELKSFIEKLEKIKMATMELKTADI